MNPPPLPVRKRFPWILYWIVLILIALFALAPVGSVVACGVIANAHGCQVDEGSVHPCIINGRDYGQLLYTLGVLGWLMLVTLPAGFFASLLWLIVLVLHRNSWRRRVAAALGSVGALVARAAVSDSDCSIAFRRRHACHYTQHGG